MKKLFIFGFKLLVSLGLLAFLFQYTDGAGALRMLASAEWNWLLVSFLLLTLQTVAMAGRWKLTAGRLGLPIGMRQAVSEYYLAQFVNQTLPGGMIGDAARAIRTRHHADLGRAVHAVMIERLTGQAAVFCVAATGFFIALTVPGGMQWPEWTAQAFILGAIAAGAMGLIIAYLADFTPMRRFLEAVHAAVFSKGVREHQAVFATAIVALNLGAFYACARAIGAVLPLEAVVTVVPLVLTAMLIPASVGGWGWRESAAAALFPIAGAGNGAGMAAGIAYGMVLLFASLPGILFLLKAIQSRDKRNHSAVNSNFSNKSDQDTPWNKPTSN